jgi:hypothetical protein
MEFIRLTNKLLAKTFAIILFVIGFIPYGLIMRLLQFDPLNRSITNNEETFWEDPAADNHDIDDFKNQY